MKRLTMNLMVLAATAMPFLFASCDDGWDDPDWWNSYDNGDYGWNNDYNNGYDTGGDDQLLAEAQALNGEWQGTMQYTSGSTGTATTFDVDMIFTQYSTSSLSGSGIEYDTSGEDSQTLNFKWYVEENTGDIYIQYTSGDVFVMDASAKEHGFYLETGKSFEGYMIGTNNTDMAYIDLSRVTENSAKPATRATVQNGKTFGAGANLVKPSAAALRGLPKR